MAEKTHRGPGPDVKPPRPEHDESRSNVRAAFEAFAEMQDEVDDDDATWREAMRDIDAQRPHRPLFKGLY